MGAPSTWEVAGNHHLPLVSLHHETGEHSIAHYTQTVGFFKGGWDNSRPSPRIVYMALANRPARECHHKLSKRKGTERVLRALIRPYQIHARIDFPVRSVALSAGRQKPACRSEQSLVILSGAKNLAFGERFFGATEGGERSE